MATTITPATKAMTWMLLNSQPFFASLVMRMEVREATDKDPECPVAYTDGARIIYNSEVFAAMPEPERAGVLAHEVMHCALLHHLRREGRDPERWNIATDYAINIVLHDAGMKLPQGGLIDAQYRGMTAEEIYNKLPEQPSDQQKQKSAATGTVGDGENANGTEGDKDAEERRWQQTLAEAAQAAKMSGHLPSALEIFINGQLAPKVRWAEALSRFMTERSPDDYSWQRPNRRFIGGGLFMPSRQSSNTLGEIVVAIDTSGSMTQELLERVAAELNDIKQAARPTKLHVVYCDSDIQHVDTFGLHDDIELALRGGGGTSFQPVFDWIEENEINPRCLVYFTDGYAEFPEQPHSYPVMWAIIDSSETPPWGEILHIDA